VIGLTLGFILNARGSSQRRSTTSRCFASAPCVTVVSYKGVPPTRLISVGQFGCSHPVSLYGEDSCFVVS